MTGARKLRGASGSPSVDTLGLLIAVRVVAADVPEREGAKQLRRASPSGTPSPATAGSDLGRWWVFGGRLSDVGDGHLPLDYRSGATPGWGQRIRPTAQALDSRAHLRLAALVPSAERRLRATA